MRPLAKERECLPFMSPETELSEADYEACKNLTRHILRHSNRASSQNNPAQTIRDELIQSFSREYAHVEIEDEPTDTGTDTAQALVQHYTTNDQWKTYWQEQIRKKGYSEAAIQLTRVELRARLMQCYQGEDAAASGTIGRALTDFHKAVEILDFRASGRAIDALNPLLMKVIHVWREQGFSTADFELL